MRHLGLVLLVALGAVSAGCAGGQVQLRTPRYTLSHPDYWKVKAQGLKDGEASVVTISSYGDAVIDDGSGAMSPRGQNYEAVTADIEVRLYGWAEATGPRGPTAEVTRLLAADTTLALGAHRAIPETPPECGLLRRKYRVFGAEQEPLDLLRRPGWRTIVVGATGPGVLLGVVARVEFEQDVARFCHNLKNMQVQLQNLLDGISAGAGPAVTK